MKTMNVVIKMTMQQQHQQLLNLWDESVDTMFSHFTETQLNQIEALYVKHRYFEHLCLFHIEVGSKIAGFIGFTHNKIEMVMVSPRFKRQGIASQLIQYALDHGAVYADISENNTIAYKFYCKHGFEQIARSEYDSEGYPSPILHLKLK